jgi:hypothetical protein
MKQEMTELRRVDLALKAIAFATDLHEAVVILKQAYDIDTTTMQLEGLRWQNMDRYRECAREMAPLKEGDLTMEQLDNAQIAARVAKKGLLASEKRLEADEEKEPARVARDASQVMSQAVDKRLAAEGRPTQIIEKRSPEQIAARLAQLGIKVGPAIEATAEEEEDD